MEFFVDTNGGYDRLTVSEAISQSVGNDGVSWTSDDDADLIGMPFDEVTLMGTDFADGLFGQGGRGTGAPLTTAKAFTARGGRGVDLVCGSDIPGGDTLSGGIANDTIEGGAGNDTIRDRRQGSAEGRRGHRHAPLRRGRAAGADRRPRPDGSAGHRRGGGGGADPMTADTTLNFSLRGAKVQRLLRQKAVLAKVTSPDEPTTIVARGVGTIRPAGRAKATSLKVGPVATPVAAGAIKTVKLRLSKKQLATVRKALAAGKRPKVNVTVQARDAADNTVTRTLRDTAKR